MSTSKENVKKDTECFKSQGSLWSPIEFITWCDYMACKKKKQSEVLNLTLNESHYCCHKWYGFGKPITSLRQRHLRNTLGFTQLSNLG